MTGKVVFAHLHPPGETSASFEKSKLGLILEELDRLTDGGGGLLYLPQMAAAGRLGEARNEVARRFLTTTADWLLFVDSDMGFEPDLLARLLSAADPQERPVVGGLAFASRFDSFTEGHGCAITWQPTLYQRLALDDGQVSYEPAYTYPQDAVVQVDGTGAAVLLIHRGVLERLGADPFAPFAIGTNKGTAGEDIAFCERLHRAGIPIHVNTAAKTNHHKDVWYSEADYLDQRQPAGKVVVVIAAGDLPATRQLVGKLHAQGGYTDLLVCNTGTDPAMAEWLDAQGVADVLEARIGELDEPHQGRRTDLLPDCDREVEPSGAAEGSGAAEPSLKPSSANDGLSRNQRHRSDLDIPAVWNAAIDETVARHHGYADVVLLSPDVRVGPSFLRRLLRGSGSPDALVLTADQIASGYRFPTDAAA